MNNERCHFNYIWVFMGVDAVHPSAVFHLKDAAEQWIATSHLTGTLTAYPLDISVYDWAKVVGVFTPRKEYQSTPRFIGRFSSAYLDHYHYIDGISSDSDFNGNVDSQIDS